MDCKQQSCCYRETLSDANRCAWHADPTDTTSKTYLNLLDSIGDGVLDGANLSGMSFDHTLPLDGASLRSANLRETDFAAVGEFTEANLRKADLVDANLNSTTFTGSVS